MLAIDWLGELERNIEKGQIVLACPGAAEKEWIIGKPIEQLRTVARRVAEAKKISVTIVKLSPKGETLAGELFLVPTKIIETQDRRGNSQIQWSTVDTKEAAEMMRDVKYGPAPYFGMQTEEIVSPTLIKREVN
ncbi:MAG: hypothetical protein SGJ02_04305 [bacterium]|mgnify:CR=1 FL=1|nr:hypothetical protein [bacterium]